MLISHISIKHLLSHVTFAATFRIYSSRRRGTIHITLVKFHFEISMLYIDGLVRNHWNGIFADNIVTSLKTTF